MTGMPEISRFFGVIIKMFYNDHLPAHFHAEYGEHEALIEIDTLGVYRGELPRRRWRWFWNGQRCTVQSSSETGIWHETDDLPKGSHRLNSRSTQ
jgi:hypothetical protein